MWGLADDFKPLQTQIARSIRQVIFNPPTRNVCIAGAVGTGKTYNIISSIHCLCVMQKTKVAIARSEKTTLYSTLIPTFRKVLKDGIRSGPLFEVYGGERRPQELHYRNGSKILFTGADNDKIFGGEYDLIYLNEVRLIDDIKYSDISGRLREGGFQDIDGLQHHLVLSDTNPAGPNHWIKIREREQRLTLINTTLRDNPEYYYDGQITPAGREYEAVLFESYGTSGWQYERYVLGKWVASEGMVWPEFNEETHVIDFTLEDVPFEYDVFGSADYGLKVACYQLWLVSKDRRRAWLFKEIYRSGLTEHRLAGHIKELHARYNMRYCQIVGDPAGDGNQTLIDAGLSVSDAYKEILYGVDIVKQWLSCADGLEVRFNRNSLSHDPDPELLRSGHPTQTIHEIPDYAHKDISKQTTGTYRDDIPDKAAGKDHGCDCIRYRLVELASPDTYVSPIMGRRSIKKKPAIPGYMR